MQDNRSAFSFLANFSRRLHIAVAAVIEYNAITTDQRLARFTVSRGSPYVLVDHMVLVAVVENCVLPFSVFLPFLANHSKLVTHTAADLIQLSKAVTRAEIAVTPTMMRKLVATSVVGSQSNCDTNAVANHMNHGVETSRRHYQNVQGDHNSVRAFTLIRASNANPAEDQQEEAAEPPSKRMCHAYTSEQTDLVQKHLALSATSSMPSVSDVKDFLQAHKEEMGGRSVDQIREKAKSILN